jgi:hypothetical protein
LLPGHEFLPPQSPSRSVLKRMKDIQKTLKSTDLSWT